jgi:thymidylate synthase (FAD)
MEVILLAHTRLSDNYVAGLPLGLLDPKNTDGQMVALSAIRTCYSHLKPSEIVEVEGSKYFGRAAKDGENGTEADRLIRHIMNSGHTSTMEHLTFTFSIEGVSRSLLAQLTRHRHFSYSVQSQRYVKLESDSKSGGFDYIVPKSVSGSDEAIEIWNHVSGILQEAYDELRHLRVPAEDARYILPNATTCNLVLTGSLRSILEFYSKRNPTTHAQWEIQELAEKIKEEVIYVEPWTESFFSK